MSHTLTSAADTVDTEQRRISEPSDARPVCQPVAQTGDQTSSGADAQPAEHGWFYVSFATDDGFRGGVIVRATSIVEACREAHRLKINPGGQAIGDSIPSARLPPAKFRNRLLSKDDLDECWDDCVRLSDVYDPLDVDKIPRVDQ